MCLFLGEFAVDCRSESDSNNNIDDYYYNSGRYYDNRNCCSLASVDIADWLLFSCCYCYYHKMRGARLLLIMANDRCQSVFQLVVPLFFQFLLMCTPIFFWGFSGGITVTVRPLSQFTVRPLSQCLWKTNWWQVDVFLLWSHASRPNGNCGTWLVGCQTGYITISRATPSKWCFKLTVGVDSVSCS